MDNSAIKERETFLSIAEAYIDRSLYEEALHIAESWLRRFPIDADAHIIRCHALLRMGNLEKVNEILDDWRIRSFSCPGYIIASEISA